MEKALHEMRTESAETKVTAECQLAEAPKMMEEAQKKILDAEEKLRGAAERMLQEVEAREDDLSRRISAFKAEYVFSSSFHFLDLQFPVNAE